MAVTHLPWMPNNPGLLWPEAEREAVKIWGWLGVNGSPVTSSESPDGSCPCPDREQHVPSAMGHARARRPALPLHGERDSRSIPGPGVPQPTSVPSPTITFPL